MPLASLGRDPDLFAAARRALDRCPDVPPGVHVHVAGGTVTLTGSVPRPEERVNAEHAVRAVIGSAALLNHITVDAAPDIAGLEPPERVGRD
jgi:osmotically-inducible protein OsmY